MQNTSLAGPVQPIAILGLAESGLGARLVIYLTPGGHYIRPSRPVSASVGLAGPFTSRCY